MTTKSSKPAAKKHYSISLDTLDGDNMGLDTHGVEVFFRQPANPEHPAARVQFALCAANASKGEVANSKEPFKIKASDGTLLDLVDKSLHGVPNVKAGTKVMFYRHTKRVTHKTDVALHALLLSECE